MNPRLPKQFAALAALVALTSFAPACYVDVEVDDIGFEADNLTLSAEDVAFAGEEWTLLTWDYTDGAVEIFRDGALIASGAGFEGFHSVRRRPHEVAATFFVCEAEATSGYSSRCSNAVTLTYPAANDAPAEGVSGELEPAANDDASPAVDVDLEAADALDAR